MVSGAEVFVVDDDIHMCSALARLFRGADLPVRTFDHAQAFLDRWRPDWHGCLVLDIHMPEMNGLMLQQVLRERDIRIPIIFLTGHGDIGSAVAAMRAGAADFLQKPFDNDELLVLVRRTLESGVELRRAQVHSADVAQRIASLTAREREVMELMLEGKLSKVIAADLGLSPRTVEIHRARVMEKMQVRSMAELVRLATVVLR